MFLLFDRFHVTILLCCRMFQGLLLHSNSIHHAAFSKFLKHIRGTLPVFVYHNVVLTHENLSNELIWEYPIMLTTNFYHLLAKCWILKYPNQHMYTLPCQMEKSCQYMWISTHQFYYLFRFLIIESLETFVSHICGI